MELLKIYGLTGQWLLIDPKDEAKYLADGYLLEPPAEEVKPKITEEKQRRKREK